MIGIIDYGIGNLRSVYRAVEAVGGPVRMVKSPAEFADLQAVILPGVGNFGDCCLGLRRSGMEEATKEWAQSGKPFLGICVGYQMLFESSEEAPSVPGLGLFPGRVRKFLGGGLKVPQIGWNQVRKKQDSPFLRGIEDGDFVYFVHSYYVEPTEASLIGLETDYGIPFASAIAQDNLFATQFHPEKSQKAGLQIFKNLVTLSA